MEPKTHEELLAAHHEFPGVFRMKAIGSSDNGFVERVIAAAAAELAGRDDVAYSVRDTNGGRHQAVSMDLNVQSPEQVMAIYAKLRTVEGLSMLL